MRIALSTDHGGYEALRALKPYIESLGHECVYLGPKILNMDDDYPDLIAPAAKAVASGDCQRGIILGVSGQGEAMAANRFKGVRCAVFYSQAVSKTNAGADQSDHNPFEVIELSRKHNDANMLSLSGRFLDSEDMKTAVKILLETPFSGEERHARRNHKLDELN